MRAKVFEDAAGSTYNDALGLGGGGLLELSVRNGFFFVGFLEFHQTFGSCPIFPITQDPSVWNQSTCLGKVLDLNWWFIAVLMRCNKKDNDEQKQYIIIS